MLAILQLWLLFCVTASKRKHLVNNLQNLSVSDRVRMLREMPLSVAEKSNLRSLYSPFSPLVFRVVRCCLNLWVFPVHRGLALQKERQTQASRKMHCCSQLKYYTIIVSHLHLRRSEIRIRMNVFGFKDLLGHLF